MGLVSSPMEANPTAAQPVDSGRQAGGIERTIWVAHPSPAALVPLLLLFLGGSIVIAPYLPVVLQGAADATFRIIPWTQAGADRTLEILRIGIHLPAAVILLRMGLLYFTRYELTTQRLRVCRGILMRRHDEIGLHRIRDYAIRRPLFGLVFGYGSVRIISRDPTLPVLDMQWLPRAHEKAQEIRRHALTWKERMGYREFDTGSLS